MKRVFLRQLNCKSSSSILVLYPFFDCLDLFLSGGIVYLTRHTWLIHDGLISSHRLLLISRYHILVHASSSGIEVRNFPLIRLRIDLNISGPHVDHVKIL